MDPKKSKSTAPEFSRREFLRTVGAGAPTISMVAATVAAPGIATAGIAGGAAQRPDARKANGKFTPIVLDAHFNASARDFGPRARAATIGGASAEDKLIRVPGGQRSLQGMPFTLGAETVDGKSWLLLSTRRGPAAAAKVEIPLQQKAHYLCLATFCDFDPNELPEPGAEAFQQVGQRLADATLVYEDGGTRVTPIRRRYETNSVEIPWGHNSYASIWPGKMYVGKLTDPLPTGTLWGRLQDVVESPHPVGPGLGIVWICAIANPEPDRAIRALRLEAASNDALIICGLTLYHRPTYPFRFDARVVYRVTLPEAAAEDVTRWHFDIDLGAVGRIAALPEFDSQAWLESPAPGLGEKAKPVENGRYLYVDVTANPAATLTLEDSKTSRQYRFELEKVAPGSELEASESGGRIEIIEQNRRWIHCRIVDAETKQPTPVRLAFRSKEGRYLPPHGHRTEINDAWFQDYGADVKLMDTPFAYIDGTCQVELPAGEVYLEMTKGFEYQPVRRKIEIAAGQRELTVEIRRLTNLRTKGWVTADTHTHFLSPTTALLEAQAEGVNLINLLAAQWGGMFSNVGDLSHGPVISKDRESMVWVGSENRGHTLGHISMLGVHGAPVFPLSADGPVEAYFGDPLWTSMAEWADNCRERQGLVVSPHFPFPTGEIAADIVLGKIDAVEIWPRADFDDDLAPLERFNALRYRDWYHYLNCGYRLPAVAGTDKMGAYMAVGANRVYAYLGQDEFNFENWAKAVRNGNTFGTTGPLLFLHADGHAPGDEITLGAGGGTVEVAVDALSNVPIHRVEIVLNGKVVASREQARGIKALRMSEKVKVTGPGWIAARCASQYGPTTTWPFRIAAHTSPVYIKIPGQDLFSPEAASYFLQLIDGAQTYVETLATRPDPETYARIVKVYTDAHAKLHQRMHEHGIPH